MRVSNGMTFQSISDYYTSADGLDKEQLGEIVSATLPNLHRHEA